MTELGRELLNAFERLKGTFEQQEPELHSALERLPRKYARAIPENKPWGGGSQHMRAPLAQIGKRGVA
ncbi:MbeD/MobD family mobilization/exclusion protein, partial [Salmonella enterica]|uniref:MbeD/MobD family mobilization/exclusion protein n=1 Tax=Salmonella enterica TaxID=28901 RepID=UPI000AEB56B6